MRPPAAAVASAPTAGAAVPEAAQRGERGLEARTAEARPPLPTRVRVAAADEAGGGPAALEEPGARGAASARLAGGGAASTFTSDVDRQKFLEAGALHQDLKGKACSVAVYFPWCLTVTAATSVLALMLWSDLGAGPEVIRLLRRAYPLRFAPLCAALAIVLALYLLDFFWPPHLEGRLCALWEGDVRVGRSALAAAGLLALLSLLFWTREHASIPVLLTMFSVPFLLALLRWLAPPPPLPPDAWEVARRGSRESRTRLLRQVNLHDTDVKRFLQAALASFLVCFLGTMVSFGTWVAPGTSSAARRHEEQVTSAELQEETYVVWSAPLIVAFSNLSFGLAAASRIWVQRRYNATDPLRSLLEDGADAEAPGSPTASRDHLGDAARAPMAKLGSAGLLSLSGLGSHVGGRSENVQVLSQLLNLVMYVMLFVIGSIYCVFKLVYVDRALSSVIMGFLALFYMTFVVFALVAFRRIVHAIGKSMQELPVWKTLRRLTDDDWVRALLICPFVLILPCILVVSALNEWVRTRRGIRPLRGQEESAPREGCWSLLTPRVASAFDVVRRWDTFRIMFRCYVLCSVFMCFKLIPIILNIALAWMTEVLKLYFGYWVMVLLVFFVGVVAFLLPPVPGLTVYMFGGLVLSNPETCPYGFWGGATINVVMSLLLKLTACSVQQKCIGEALGRRLWVRRLAGVHLVRVRCLESVMRRPGLSIGKVAILCGGPDWPVSVLAGVLRLDLLQCLIGTLPIIFFIVPCALSGSFYLRRSIDVEAAAFWGRSASAMVVTSVGISLLLWALIAWVIRVELRSNHEELTRRLPENVDLEWLDFEHAELQKACSLSWEEVHPVYRTLYVAGAGVQMLVCDTFALAARFFLGDFQVYYGLENLRWLNDGTNGGIFTPFALLCLALFSCSLVCPVPLVLWRRRKTRAAREQARRRLRFVEAPWKEAWLREARRARTSPAGGGEGAGVVEEASAAGKGARLQDLAAGAAEVAQGRQAIPYQNWSYVHERLRAARPRRPAEERDRAEARLQAVRPLRRPPRPEEAGRRGVASAVPGGHCLAGVPTVTL